ncbi:MAG TPA: PIN domain-containing protein [Acidobacteriota bacterium]|nr:PIN domain-containing protein [Acidobacteriota bacterium]
MRIWMIRGLFTLAFTLATYFLRPFSLSGLYALLTGFLISLVIVTFEMAIRGSSLKALIGAGLGVLLGIAGATLVSLIIDNMTFLDANTATFLQVLTLAAMTYVGLLVGVLKGDSLNLDIFGLVDRGQRRSAKVLDTSVIIDGRVADVLETGFIDGQLLVPEFVLRELQMVADSADSVKRNRGRRGLDILQKIQKKPGLRVKIVDHDYPSVREVDMKLIELAKETNAKIVTNDFNLNKVAQLRGVEVLNINELANALKPVVLPGEIMRVFILKEGKEYNQGVAYLDDGTMVVVDNARRKIGKTVDIQVTSVLQTTAGKMIFGKYQSGEGSRSSQREEARQQKVGNLQ